MLINWIISVNVAFLSKITLKGVEDKTCLYNNIPLVLIQNLRTVEGLCTLPMCIGNLVLKTRQ